MANKRKRLSDTEIQTICAAELDASSATVSGGELQAQRSDALDRYLGEPYGDEIEGRSQVRTREVLSTVEWLKPSLMRIFADSENIVSFDPVGPEDEQQAEQETDRCSYAYWKENRGFFNTLTFVTDALLSKTGIMKVTWVDGDERAEREEYSGLNDIELGMLMHDEDVERELIEHELREDGHYAVFEATDTEGRIEIEACAPENFGVTRSARSPYAKDAEFCWHRELKTRSDLLEAGYDRDIVDRLPSASYVETEEELSRRHLDDEQAVLRNAVHHAMNEIWVTECYIRVDRNGDGINELLRVTLATGSGEGGSNSTLLDIEEVDRIPFSTVSPVILTHKFYGLSIADLVMDLQAIKTTLLRGMLDNMYLANNGRTAFNERVSLDDILLSRPGGAVRVEGKEPITGALQQLQHPPPPPEVFGLMEYLDNETKERTGAGAEMSALEPTALANVNTGVAALAHDAARARIELIAEIFAEIGFRPIFEDIHELLSKNLRRKHLLKMRGEWVSVNPAEWKKRENVTMNVGLGVASKQRKILGLERVLEGQILAMQSQFPITTPQQVFQCISDLTKELGHEPTRYWTDPAQMPPPQPPPPDPQLLALQMSAQVAQGEIEVKRERNQIDAGKAQAEAQLKQLELGMRRDEAILRAQVEAAKAEVGMLRSQLDNASKEQRMALESLISAREQERADAELRLKQTREEGDRQVDVFKAVLQSGTQLTTAQMSAAGLDEGGQVPYIDQLAQTLVATVNGQLQQFGQAQGALLGQMSATIVHLREQAEAPRVIERDGDGLVVSVGGRPVTRDSTGRMVSIG